MKTIIMYILSFLIVYFVISPFMIWGLDIFLERPFDSYLHACVRGFGLIIFIAFVKALIESKNFWKGEW